MADINITKINDTRLKAKVRTTSQESEQARIRAMEKLQKKVKVPGFRPGKVPLHIIRQKFADELMLDSLHEAVIGCVDQIAAKSEHGFYSIISLDNVDLKGDAYAFELTFDLPPYIKPGKLKEATIRENIFQMSEDDYDNALRVLRLQKATYEDKSTPAEKGDQIIFDYEILVDGIPMGEPKIDNKMILGQESSDPILEQKLLEARAVPGTEVRYERTPVTRPNNQEDDKPYTVILTVKKVQKVILPEITDEWVQRNSATAKTVAEFREEIHKDLEAFFNKRSLKMELSRALEQFAKDSQFFFSESYLNDKVEEFLKSSNILADQVSPEQIQNLKKSIADREKHSLVINYLMKEIRKKKSSEDIRAGFRSTLEKNFSGSTLDDIMSLYDAVESGKKLEKFDYYTLNSALSDYYNLLIKEHLKSEGLIKKGKKMSLKELMDELQQVHSNQE